MSSAESLLEKGLPVENKRSDPFRWIILCLLVLSTGAAVFFSLLYFKIIPSSTNKEEQLPMPEVLAVRSYLDSMPLEVKGQIKAGKKLAAHCPGHKQNKQLVWEKSTLMDEDSDPEDEQVKLQNNALVIPSDGLYFVYTQVAFTGRNCNRNQPLYLSHTVNRRSLSYEAPEPVLTSTKSVCEVKSGSPWFQPMYQGGLFQLEKGDILSTVTSNVDHLDANESQVYFGVVAI
ncbi:tumor necrosis factor-like [Bombina bombina]|uniref:tumor necrosis factor-like n=1 Tax=Bombina bombina TaxID=8345 RepID=UPI00235A51CF|nr:tumor necrosis factor-like [Bombina bombina]